SGFSEGNVPEYRSTINSRNLARRIGGFSVLSLTLLAGELFGQIPQVVPQPTSPPAAQRDLSQVSLEDLMNIKVTSVSKTEQKMSQAAAAIFVITQEDIRARARQIFRTCCAWCRGWTSRKSTPIAGR